LVLRPGALGDTLLAVPALRALRRCYPPVTLAAHPGATRLLETLGEIDRGFAFDDLSSEHLSEQLTVAWMTSAPALSHLAVVAPSRPPDDEHCAHYLLRTLAPLGIAPIFDDHPLNVTPIHSQEILVHPGSGSRSKNWPPDRFAAVVRALDEPVRVVVGEADVAAAAEVESRLGYRLERLEHPPLAELAARLAGCRAYLGNDSGVSHLAGLCGAHTVTLFGPTNPSVWRPVGPDVAVLGFEATANEVVETLRC
jgi:ADP-heptose:LPS heptosyltransferase